MIGTAVVVLVTLMIKSHFDSLKPHLTDDFRSLIVYSSPTKKPTASYNAIGKSSYSTPADRRVMFGRMLPLLESSGKAGQLSSA